MSQPPPSLNWIREGDQLRCVLGQPHGVADQTAGVALFVLISSVIGAGIYATWSAYTPLIALLAVVSLVWTAMLWREMRKSNQLELRITPRRLELSTGTTVRLEDVERVESVGEGLLIVKRHLRIPVPATAEQSDWLAPVLTEVAELARAHGDVREHLAALRHG